MTNAVYAGKRLNHDLNRQVAVKLIFVLPVSIVICETKILRQSTRQITR